MRVNRLHKVIQKRPLGVLDCTGVALAVEDSVVEIENEQLAFWPEGLDECDGGLLYRLVQATQVDVIADLRYVVLGGHVIPSEIVDDLWQVVPLGGVDERLRQGRAHQHERQLGRCLLEAQRRQQVAVLRRLAVAIGHTQQLLSVHGDGELLRYLALEIADCEGLKVGGREAELHFAAAPLGNDDHVALAVLALRSHTRR
mmetsp:Transcript_7792/g.19184  ORF Transcript_7792/g.19184 Transcript_7792/m.19184 type:complete len:200 (+) Transcript_7792:2523-3122(+)